LYICKNSSISLAIIIFI